MKNAVIMARVSSDEQALGYSLGVQEEAMRRHCSFHDIEVIKFYREDHSAKDFNRPEFIQFLKFAKANKGKIDYLIFTSWDRFSRNITDAFVMIRKMKKLGIEPRAIEQPLDFSIPESKAMLAIYLAIPEIDNDRRSIKIRGGVRGALKAGRWSRKAPRGYINRRDENNKPIIIPGERAALVRFLFEEVARGRIHEEIRKELMNKGMRMSRNGLSRMLRNTVYMGKIIVPACDDEPEVQIEGIHEGIISESLFMKVQDLIDGNRQKRNAAKSTNRRPELPLRGNLCCSNCGSNLTGSRSLSGTGSYYFYYHCNNCRKVRFRADMANSLVEDVLGEFRFKKSTKKLYDLMVKAIFKGTAGERLKRSHILEENISLQKERLENLQDMMLDEKLSLNDYNSMKQRIEKANVKMEIELEDIRSVKSNWEGFLKQGIHLLSNIPEYYRGANLKQKEHFLSSIFPEKLEISKNKCRTTRVNQVLRLILLIDKDLLGLKKGQLTRNLELSPWVELEGVEPSSR
ncbi:MAG: recombinase family protein [Flavobacteriales bacterium]|nr:recombinase family protein [Flavobacteriales bacterium]